MLLLFNVCSLLEFNYHPGRVGCELHIFVKKNKNSSFSLNEVIIIVTLSSVSFVLVVRGWV